ncbi:MAG: hypothetical protein JST12_20275 [Armatimonadetes bacterium]|nr:hypothetical protein [Armatimonadota bacterium]
MDRSIMGTIVRVFPTTNAWQIHRNRLKSARRVRLYRHLGLLLVSVAVIALAVVYQMVLYEVAAPLALLCAVAWFANWLGEEASDLRKVIENEHAEVERMHMVFEDTAWEVSLDDGTSAVLKGFLGERGDRIGVNFIGDWTPSIFNLRTDAAVGREQLCSQLAKSDQRHLFFVYPDAYRAFIDGEAARIRDYALTERSKDGTSPS